MVQESPIASWTRGASKTASGAQGRRRPGGRLLDFVLCEAPTLTAQAWRR
jgi:hypothetical protein